MSTVKQKDKRLSHHGALQSTSIRSFEIISAWCFRFPLKMKQARLVTPSCILLQRFTLLNASVNAAQVVLEN